jgi:hypothetical protein
MSVESVQSLLTSMVCARCDTKYYLCSMPLAIASQRDMNYHGQQKAPDLRSQALVVSSLSHKFNELAAMRRIGVIR